MDACQTSCRVLMVLLGLGSLLLGVFLCYDLGLNFMNCRLHFVIIGRFAIAFSTLYVCSCCGIIPKPKIRMPRNWPTPWKLWEFSCIFSQNGQQHVSADVVQPIAFGSQARDVSTTPLTGWRQRRYDTFHETIGRQYPPAVDFYEPEWPGYYNFNSDDDSRQPGASTSQARKVVVPVPILRHRDETSSETHGQKKEPKRVRFAFQEKKDRRSLEGVEERTEKESPYDNRNVDLNSRLKKTQQRISDHQRTVDQQRSRLIAMGVNLEQRSVQAEDPLSRVLVEQDRENYEGSPNAESPPIPISNPRRSPRSEPGTPPRVSQRISLMYARIRGRRIAEVLENVPPSRALIETLSSEIDPSEIPSFEDDIADRMSP